MSETDFCLKAPAKALRRRPGQYKISSRPLSRKQAKDSRSNFPIPKGNTPYVKAKRAEYIERDLSKAEIFYTQAIQQDDRAESSVKDLAGILHQQGRTAEACQLLEDHQHLFKADHAKYENLLNNLQRQVTPSGNCLNKTLKVSGLQSFDTPAEVCSLFKNSTRIISVAIGRETVDGLKSTFALLKFTSHSAARKTLESFHDWEVYKVEWVSVTGEVVGDACHSKERAEVKRLAQFVFTYSLFLQDPKSWLYALPVDSQLLAVSPCKASEQDMEGFLGSALMSFILNIPA